MGEGILLELVFVGQLAALILASIDGDLSASERLQRLEKNLSVILKPFGDDIETAASLFTETLG